MGVGVAIGASDEELAKQMVDLYGAAVRGIMLQHQSLDTDEVTCIEVEWIDENNDDIASLPNQVMLYKGVSSLFVLHIEGVTSRWAGPAIPDESAQIYGEVDQTNIVINDDVLVHTE
jgi:hypothetical protein